MDGYQSKRIRAWALEAAARSTVNPGHVIRIATRYAYFIEHGTDPGEGMQNVTRPVCDMGNACENCGCGYGMHVARHVDPQEHCVTAYCKCSGWKDERGGQHLPGTCTRCPHVLYNHGKDGCGFCDCRVTNPGSTHV